MELLSSPRRLGVGSTILGIVLILVAGVSLVGSSGPSNSSLSASALVQQNTKTRLVRIWVHGDAVYPEVLRLPPGKVLIRAENETQSEINLVVERVTPGQSSQPLTKVRASANQKRANQELTLGAGEYVYYDESQPQYKGTLIVEPKSSQ